MARHSQRPLMNILLACSISFFFIVLTSTARAQDPEQKFQGFNLEGFTDEGEKSWEVNGDTADIVGTQIKLSNVDANTYGEEPINVTAETGYIDQTSGQMRLEKDVVVTSQDGSQLVTDSLDWDRQGDLVTTEDDVRITDSRFSAMGKGMEGRPGLKVAQIKKDVTLMVDTEPEEVDDQLVTITSDGPMVIDQALQRATFEENVIAMQGDRTLRANKMEVYFDNAMNQISAMICIGDVEIFQGDNKTFAQKAVYDAQTQKLTLSGRPKLILITEGDGGFASFGD